MGDSGFMNFNVTAVAIDKDRNSQHAVRWALDHLLINSPFVLLIHVINRGHNQLGYGDSYGLEGSPKAKAGNLADSAEMQQLFRAFRGFCARKGVQVKDIVLEDSDVAKALVDFVANNGIINLVVGTSSRNAITKKFRNHDVPSSVVKAAPDFCTVYVIAKSKVMTVRSATRPLPPLLKHTHASAILPHYSPDHLDHEDSVRNRGSCRAPASPSPAAFGERRSLERNEYIRRERPVMTTAKINPTNASFDEISIRLSRGRDSLSEDLDYASSHRASDFCMDGLDHTIVSNSPRSPISSQNTDVEAEMKRLKLELKQTIDMYSTACKEAITAKQKARELHQWKVEEARRMEEARLAEEAALAMVEMEKAKCRAAIEAAEAAQKIAEMEAQKRRNAEMKAKRELEEKMKALDKLASSDRRYRKYTIEEIEIATDRFAEGFKIGEGGYGPVYRGTLDHTPVAIKVLRPDAAQGRKQFQQEVEVLSTIRHPNMVLLLGACPEYGCLVYEYLENGSLEDRLFRRGHTPSIPWSVRFKIAAEIATALLFLHQTKPEPLVHRDLKPGNILLDRNYVSKISDVGLSRLVPPSVADSVTQYRMTSTAGTFCYIDPEYQQTGMLGIKSDIYSLGVLLLQIITAKPPMGLTHHIERAIDKGTFADMLDQTVPDWPVEEALSYANLALKCAELRRKDRPDLATEILPELNRLRALGMIYESSGASSSSSSSSSIHSGFRSPPQQHRRCRS